MIEKQLIVKGLAYLCVVCFCSCANLEHINKYAHGSAEGLEKFKEIPFSFGDYCRHYQEAALTNSLQTDIAPLPKLDCKFYSNSDTALKIFNHVLTAYLQGLEKLSDKDLVNYNLDDAATNLQALQGQIGWNVGDTQVTATKNIVTKLLNNLMNHYRKKKLKQIIEGSKNDFKIVIESYMIGIQALQGEAKLALRNYQDFYSNPLLEMAKEKALKTLLVRDYHHKEDVFAKTDKAIETYLKILKKIETGYDELAKSSDHLTADDLRDKLVKYASDFQYLNAQMADLKTSD